MSSTRSLVIASALIVSLLAYMYADSLMFLFSRWVGSEDSSHGMFVPFISGYLVWQSRHRLSQIAKEKSWWGIPIITVGLILYVVGELSTLFVLLHVSLWVVFVGLSITLLGLRGAQAIAFPLGYLLTAIPLPTFFYANLSSQLQLWSSSLGVGCLQLVGVIAFREGNVIDLGQVQLQVVEACSGIRYLLPLTALALLCAYLFKDKMWKRIVLVLSAIPISILLNGFRIGMIGVLVELYGKGAAEGFYHLFEGWVIFMVSLALLILEMGLLGRISAVGPNQPFLGQFSWGQQSKDPGMAAASTRPSRIVPTPSPAYLCSVALLIPFTVLSSALADREEIPPARMTFVDFPMQIGSWRGERFPLEKQYIDALRFDDYVLADYRSAPGHLVNFYSAYYGSQRKGQSAHSPKSCLPGGGWEIASLTHKELPSSPQMKQPVMVNRAVIRKGDQTQVVLYWFKQRDRYLADEYLVKLFLLWDAISRHRTDGALVRLASLVGPGESEAMVDQRLQEFAAEIGHELNRFVPD
ncbi:MAG: VPLPA-CTERM-specific exosortase XrtD [Nitrospira sp. WS110]|nr:VPLPA-CTERM-specific exosortase XrtD [Nitrospira sp. WS110]